MSFLQRRKEALSKQNPELADAMALADALMVEKPAPPPATPVKAELVQEKPEATHSVPASKLQTSPNIAHLRKQIRPKLLAAPDEADEWQRGNREKENIIIGRLKTIIQKANIQLTSAEYEELKEALLNDLMGYGAIEPLVQSKTVSEIMVTGAEMIFAEQKGKLYESEYVFDDEEHVQWTAQRIVRRMGRSFDRANPMTDARLPDGSRVHLLMPPASIKGTTITIRKFPAKPLTVDDLIRFGSFTSDVAQFLQACIVSRLNVVVSGGTGSGKTTLLNVLSSFIPDDERIVTIEDAAELQLTQRHVVSLETTPPIPGSDGLAGKLVIRDLVRGALRMRPDRIVVGECRGGEALDMLQAMNTGHDGSLTTVHSNSPRDAASRLETLCLMAGMDLPVFVIRSQIAAAIDLFIQQARLQDGSRKIVQVTEIQGMEGQNITLQDVFLYRTAGFSGQGYSHAGGGLLESTGFRPKFEDRLKEHGFKLPANMFTGSNKFNK
jgi:pilus assembly protein CpaF